MPDNTSISIDPIGWITSPVKEKFGAPRQPREVEAAIGHIHFHSGFNPREAFREIEHFSHLWLIFQFHQCADKPWSPTVRPPRLGGNQRVGVYASRSPFRPNSLGLSAVRNLGVMNHPEHGISLTVGGIDLIHNTPIIDIKPYLKHTDSLPESTLAYSPEKLSPLVVQWICDYQEDDRELIEQTLRLNPTPGYQTNNAANKSFGITLGDKNITFSIQNYSILVHSVIKIDSH